MVKTMDYAYLIFIKFRERSIKSSSKGEKVDDQVVNAIPLLWVALNGLLHPTTAFVVGHGYG